MLFSLMSDTQLIKDKIDIVDFIGQYISLKPAGINHKACCPFHQEKTPSFMVTRDRQRWHCFGCNKGGDIFSFLQEMEGMDFPEALNHLAQKAGVTLTRQATDPGISSQKNRLKEVLVAAARFFHHFLTDMPAAESARTYLKQRGLSLDTIDLWQIGFVPDQWDLLTQYLLKKGHAIDDLIASGLTIKRDGSANMAHAKSGFYDRFRGRIMFPIWDHHGSVVGCTGRVLVETEKSGGKYVNTPQTPLFDKSRLVFGLDKAKQSIRESGIIVLVEGQMDVITAHQAGCTNVVASSGTALTEHQVALLKRYADTIAIAFDVDAAGMKAAKRGIDIALAEGMRVKMIRIPEGAGKDPDECIQKNVAVWKQSVEQAQEVMRWYLDKAFLNRDPNNAREKQDIANEVLEEIARMPFAVERDHWLHELSRRIGVDAAVLRDDLLRISKQQASTIKHQPPAAEEIPPAEVKKDRTTNLFEDFLALILASGIFRGELTIPHLLSTHPLFPLYEAIKNEYTGNGSFDIDRTRQHLSNVQQEQLDILLMKGELDFSAYNEQEVAAELAQLHHQIKEIVEKEVRAKIGREIAEAESRGDTVRVNELLQLFQSHTS